MTIAMLLRNTLAAAQASAAHDPAAARAASR
jgi:hypothetical protein